MRRLNFVVNKQNSLAVFLAC